MQLYLPWVYLYFATMLSNKRLNMADQVRGGIKAVIPHKSNLKIAADGRSPLDREAYRNRNVEIGLHPIVLQKVMQLSETA